VIRVRLAMKEDRDEVLALAKMAVEETLPHLDWREDLAAATFDASVTTADPTCFVAVHPSGVVGFLMARLYNYAFSSGVFVSQEVIYVCPGMRGSRAAALMVMEYKRWGEIVGAREVLFGVSNGFRPEATARLFMKLGADLVGYHLRIVR